MVNSLIPIQFQIKLTIQELCIKMRVKSPIMSNYKILALMNPSGANIVQCCENNFYTA